MVYLIFVLVVGSATIGCQDQLTETEKLTTSAKQGALPDAYVLIDVPPIEPEAVAEELPVTTSVDEIDRDIERRRLQRETANAFDTRIAALRQHDLIVQVAVNESHAERDQIGQIVTRHAVTLLRQERGPGVTLTSLVAFGGEFEGQRSVVFDTPSFQSGHTYLIFYTTAGLQNAELHGLGIDDVFEVVAGSVNVYGRQMSIESFGCGSFSSGATGGVSIT